MNLGAEPRKLGWLIAIVVIGGGFALYENYSSDAPSYTPAPAPRTAVQNPAPPRTASRAADRRRITNQGLLSDWKPRLGPKNPEDRRDPSSIDPAVRLDLLAKVQAVEPVAAGRSLFSFGEAPPPPGPPITLPKTPQIAVNHLPATAPPPPTGPITPPKPVAPPMTFKYYGFKVSKSDGHKAAFLLDGDDILIAGENDTIKQRRYKIVKISVTSITIEDTQFNSTQTLPLSENLAG